MLELEFRKVFGAGWGGLTNDIRALEVMESAGGPVVLAAGGPAGGLLSFRLDAQGNTAQLIDSAYYTGAMTAGIAGTLTLMGQGGGQTAILGSTVQDGAMGFSVAPDGGIGPAVTLGLPAFDGLSGPALAASASGFVYAMTARGHLQCFSATGQNTWRGGHVLRDSGDVYLADPVALETVEIGGRDFLLSLCGEETGLSVFRIDPQSGALSAEGSIGTGSGLGLLRNPTGMEVIETGGRTFVLIASAADNGTSGALSVVELHDDGSVNVTDHLLDTLTTRFGRIESLAVAQDGKWTYVAAGGGDAGVSLFVLTPEGWLLHMDSLADTTASGLEQISALSLHVSGETLRLLAASQSTIGLSQIEVSLADQGVVRESDSGMRIGTPRNDMLIGGGGVNDLRGHDGNDILVDGGGADRLTGGKGADLFVLGADGARDVITDFHAGQDRLDLSGVPMLYDSSRLTVQERAWGAILVFPGGEETEIRSATGGRLTQAEVLSAIAWGADRTPLVLHNEETGSAARDMLTGNGGTDILKGMGGADTLNGHAGDDRLEGGSGDDQLFGGSGADSLYGAVGADRLEGQGGADLLDGGDHDDWLDGGAGDDTLLGGDDADRLIGGEGDDRLEGQDGLDTLDGGFGDDWLHGGSENDRLYGGDGSDRLYGAFGADRLEGQDGADLLDGGNDNDWLHGGAQDDTILGGANADHLIGALGHDRLEGQHGFDTLDGGFGDDWLHGGSQADTLLGGGGDDTLAGALHDDRLEGQNGNDVLDGGQHNDWLHGGAGHDHLLGGGMNDTLYGAFGNDSLEGQYGADLIEGGFGDDWIHGGAMSDTIHAGGGDDTVNGGSGPDLVFLDDGADLFRGFNQGGALGRDTIWGGAGDDTIRASGGNDVAHGEADDDLIFGGAGHDLLTGGLGADTLAGEMGNDVLHGGGGADRLEPGRGFDILTGGAGADVFAFFAFTDRNEITDFTPGVDRLELDVGVAQMSDLTIVDAPRGVWLEWDGGSVLLEGLTAGDIGAGDIGFL